MMEKLRDGCGETFTPDMPTSHGFTGLHAAALHGHVECVQELLAWKADANQVTEAKMSALMFATASGHEAVARLLLNQGAQTTHAVESIASGLPLTKRAAEHLADGFDKEGLVSLLAAHEKEAQRLGHQQTVTATASLQSSAFQGSDWGGQSNASSGSKKSSKSGSGASAMSGNKQGSQADDAGSEKGSIRSRGSKASKGSKGSKKSKGSGSASAQSEDAASEDGE